MPALARKAASTGPLQGHHWFLRQISDSLVPVLSFLKFPLKGLWRHSLDNCQKQDHARNCHLPPSRKLMALSSSARQQEAGDPPSKAQLGGCLLEGTQLPAGSQLAFPSHCPTFPVRHPKPLCSYNLPGKSGVRETAEGGYML